MNSIRFEKNELNSTEHKIANQTLTFNGTNPDGSENFIDTGNLTALYNARIARETSRDKMNNSEVGTPTWREAEETLNFWQGKVAMLEIMKSR